MDSTTYNNLSHVAMSPTVSNEEGRQFPLGDVVIHADVHSIEPEEEASASQTLSSTRISSKMTPEETREEERASQMQLAWNEAMCLDGYKSVAVLIIKWSKELDQLNCEPEVKELETLFQESFNYATRVVDLNISRSKKPQLQLNRAISSFVDDFDGPNNLLIIYYTGHGTYKPNIGLELSAMNGPHPNPGSKLARCSWDTAELQLRSEDLEADTLTILDCCFASNLPKSAIEITRTYELLSACGIDQTTSSPGDNSFTRALIDSLKELLYKFGGNAFTTYNLCQTICQQEARRDTPAFLWNRLEHHNRHILLSPLSRPISQQGPAKPFLIHPMTGGYLTLRFALGHEYLNDTQIKYLAHNLKSVFTKDSKVAVRRIDWMGIKKPVFSTTFRSAALVFRFIFKWKLLVARRRKNRAAASSGAHQVTVARKRSYTDSSSNLPDTPQSEKTTTDEGHPHKKSNIGVSPLTPPVYDGRS